ncbi:TPA: universal stress protein [Morganella morganii subsp. morganii]|nr:universal stress protein [Morganella morganii subsp. morganii]
MYKNILVAIDIAEDDIFGEGLTSKLPPHVEYMADKTHTNIHFFTVIPFFPNFASYAREYDVLLDERNKITDKALSKLISITKIFNINPANTHHHVKTGSPIDQILRLSTDINADLIIIGSRQPTITTRLLGSTAAAVVRYAKASVLVVR